MPLSYSEGRDGAWGRLDCTVAIHAARSSNAVLQQEISGLRQWLLAYGPAIKSREILPRRVRGSCYYILWSAQHERWMAKPTSFL